MRHGSEFILLGVKNKYDYLNLGHEVIKNGYSIQYLYKNELRFGYIQYLGNNKKGEAKFIFVGTNNNGNITTIHTKSGKEFWKLIGSNKNEKLITPYQTK